MMTDRPRSAYRGRLAPTPTGFLHLGHASTFWIAQQRCLAASGTMILRNDDLDQSRCRDEYVEAMLDDLQWFGFRWHEGPDVGGPHIPYRQSLRGHLYKDAFNTLKSSGYLYPCNQSRRDIRLATSAPHPGDEEPIYPGTCRPGSAGAIDPDNPTALRVAGRINWRFLVTDGEAVTFTDLGCGSKTYVAGKDFGDFIVWRHDGLPAYHLATVVDDTAMGVTEVVRGKDLLTSTARQILLYRALGYPIPSYVHCPLLTDEHGKRLAKRSRSLALRTLRDQGRTPESLRAAYPIFADSRLWST